MPKEMHPDEYGDIMVEAKRVVASGPDEVIMPFQIWDLDDFHNELSIVFRAKGFQTVERLFAVNDLIRDIWFGDGDLVVLTDNEVHRFSGGNFKEPSSAKLPMKAARAIDGTAKNLFVVGDGIARFDGKSWTKLSTKKVELTHVVVHGDVAYAGGKGGLLLGISGGSIEPLSKKKTRDISALFLDSKGALSVATHDSALQGAPGKLAALELPKDVEHVVGICEFQGKTYWGTLGDDDGMGIFRQDGKKFERLIGDMGITMTATDRFLFAPGERGVLRYDGDNFAALGLDFDEDEEQWKLEPVEIPDRDDDDN